MNADEVRIAAERVANERDADVILYSGDLERGIDTDFIDECCRREKRPNVLMMLVTYGGDPDVAYRIARCLQQNYTKFTFFVTGYCKSAGTLLSLAAHELIFSDHGELGPLDVQMVKKDELGELQSGLVTQEAIAFLKRQAFSAFEEFFLTLTRRSEGAITLKTATHLAAEMSKGLFVPLIGKLDPLNIGEISREIQIALAYGSRLIETGKNLTPKKLGYIITEYPSHGFVIDRWEAENLYNYVLKPSDFESELEQVLGPIVRDPDRSIEPFFRFLSDEPRTVQETEITGDKVENE